MAIRHRFIERRHFAPLLHIGGLFPILLWCHQVASLLRSGGRGPILQWRRQTTSPLC
jgi:hypothetical protein